jgi:phosphoribosylglycinamide formyltransferase-1
MKLGVLVSGRGSNLEALLNAIAGGRLEGVEVVLVVSNRRGVRALDVAARHGVPALVLTRDEFAAARDRDRQIGTALAERGAEFVVLAGYDQLLSGAYFETFGGPTINIHPSLLPRHGGRGMVGLAVHRSVLEAGDSTTGVTIHEVTRELDGGPVLAQSVVPVLPGDDAETLAARVLVEEHRLLVDAVRALCERTPLARV